MAYKNAVGYGTLKSIDSATFTGSYQALGVPIAKASLIYKLVNLSGVSVTVSTDGVNDMDILPSNSFVIYDLTANTPETNSYFFLRQGTQFYVKGNVSTGSVYLVNIAVISGDS